MAEILGAVAAADQLVTRFTDLYKRLGDAYQTIRYARKEVDEVKKRTRTMKKLWSIFRETMEDVSNIEEFSIDFERYENFDRGLNKHAQRIIDKIWVILDTLGPLLTRRRVSAWTDFRTRLTWFARRKEDLRLLYVDMKLLTGYMKTFTNLVLLQISLKQFELGKSLATKLQVDSRSRELRAQLRDIGRIQQAQLYTGRITQENEKDDFLQEVKEIVKRELELAKSPRKAANDDSSSDSDSDSGSDSTSGSFWSGLSPGPSPSQGPSPTFPLDPANPAPGSGSHQATDFAPDASPSAAPSLTQRSRLGSSSDSDSSSESSSPPRPPPRFPPTQPRPPKGPNTGQGGLRAPTEGIRPRSNSLVQPATSPSSQHAHLDDSSADSASASSELDTEVPQSVNRTDGNNKAMSEKRVSKAKLTSRTSSGDELPIQTQARETRDRSSSEETGDESFPIPESWRRGRERGRQKNKRALAFA